MDSNSSINSIYIYRFVTTIGDEFNVNDLSVIPTKSDGGAVIKWNHTMICLDKYRIVIEDDNKNMVDDSVMKPLDVNQAVQAAPNAGAEISAS